MVDVVGVDKSTLIVVIVVAFVVNNVDVDVAATTLVVAVNGSEDAPILVAYRMAS
jgi:hypothetical protein